MIPAKQKYNILRHLICRKISQIHSLKQLRPWINLRFAIIVSVFSIFISLPLAAVYSYTRAGGDARVHAAVPATLNFQARLLQSNGAIVADGTTYSVEFKLYTADTGGVAVWTETRTSNVTIKNGYLSVYLGDVNNTLGSLDWSQQYWLTMNVNGDGEMNPRLRLTTVPYAFRSSQADTITNGSGTLSANDLVQLAPSSIQAVNTALAALRINQQGAGLLAQFQGGGSDVFTISNAGNVTAAGSLDVGAAITAGSGNAFQVNTSGDITAVSTALDGSSTANGGSGLGTSTSLVLNNAANFDVGNYVQMNSANCGGTGINPCYAKITAKASNTLTITPALRWTSGSAVTEYHIPEIGGVDTSQTLANRYGRGYFISGVATGNGTTYYNEDEITSSLDTFSLLSTNVTTLNIGAAATTINLGNASTSLQLSGLSFSNAAVDIGNLTTAGVLDIFDGTGQKATISTANLTADRTFTLPDASGTFCLTNTCLALGGNASTGTATLGTTNANAVAIITNNVQAINIDTAGNVRIGNGSATEKLDVNGGIRVGNSTGTNAGTIRWNGSDFEGYNGTEWKSFTQGGGIGNLGTTYTNNVVNVTANNTALATRPLLASGNTAISAVAGPTVITAPANGSFRTCTMQSFANVTGGSISVRWRVNGVSVGSAACTLSTANNRQASTFLESGVVTFNAGDQITVVVDAVALAPSGSNDFIINWTVEYESAISGGGGASNLQQAYDGSGAPALINTSDAKNLQVNLSDTATDSNFLVNILTGSTGRFAIQDNGTDALAVASSGITLSKAVTASAGINLSNSGITNAGNITGVGTNLTATASLTIASTGANDLTLNSGSGIAVLGATTLRTSNSLTLDVNNAANTTLALQNNGAGTATLNLADGALQTAGTTRLTNGGALQNITGLTVSSGGASITGNITLGSASSERLTINGQLLGGSPLVFQGATDNGFATTFAITDPTANNTITFPNASGTLVLDTRSILAGTGLTGGGNLSADRTLSLDINGLTTTTAINNSDTLAIYDGAGIKKIARSDFLQGLTGALQYQGTWDASTNTPSISDATGTAGHIYAVSVGGTQNLGSGSIAFGAGDFVIHNGTIWQRAPSSSTVASVFGRTGAVTAQNGDYTASQITNVAAGGLSSITVQAALNELDTEKLSGLNGLSTSNQTFANDTNVTITSAGSTHTLGWSGLLSVGRGGTGAGSFTTNGVVFGNNTGALQATAAGTGGQLLLANASGVPTFTSLSGDATISDTGVLTIGANAVTLGTDTAGDYIASLGTLTGLSVTGNSGEGSTPALSVIYGSTANTSVQGNTAITVTAGTNLSGGGNITLGAGGTVTLNTVANPSFGTSVTTPLVTNAGGLTLSSTGAGNDITLTSADKIILTGFDCSTNDNGGVLTVNNAGEVICDNDDGGTAGSVTGSGTAGRITFYSGTSSLGDSWLLQDVSTLKLDTGRDFDLVGGNLQLAGTTVLTSAGALQNITNVTASGTITFSSLSAGGLVKADTSGALDIAVAGTDYEVPLTFNNGLTRTSNNVALGGSLTADTTINMSTFDLSLSGTGTVGIGATANLYKLSVNAGAGLGLSVISDSYSSFSSTADTYSYLRAVTSTDSAGYFELGAYDITGVSQGGRALVLNSLGGNVGVGSDTTPDGLFSVGSTSAFQVNDSGNVIVVGLNNTNGGITNTGSIAGATTISASGAITAATSVNTINGLIINGGALSGVTGLTFTSGSLNLNNGGITNTGSIAGATTISASGAITAATATNTINGLIINSGALSGVTGLTFTSGSLNLNNGGITNTGSIAGATTISVSGAISAATTTDTINGLVINAGALSSVTGFTQTSGNFAISGSGTFGTGTGAVSLSGATTVTGTNTFTVNGGLASLNAGLSVTGVAEVSTRIYVPGTSGTTGQGYFTGSPSVPLGAFQSLNLGVNTFSFFANNKHFNGTAWVDNGLARTGSSFQIQNDSFTFYSFDTGTTFTPRFTVATGGNVGVGTTGAPAGLLSVGGTTGNFQVSSAGAITAPTSTNTINGLIINAGSLSGVTGFTQTSGNFAMSGTGTFGTGTGAISLNGATTVTGTNTFAVSGGLTTLSAGLTVTGAVNFNVSANNAVNINTGTSTGAITLGGGSGAFTVASTGVDITANAISDSNSITSVNNTNLTLNALGTGSLVFTGYNCTGNTSNGNLTANASGVISCDDDNTGLSDARLKENIVDLNNSILDRIKDVRTVNFDFDCEQEFFANSLKDCLTGRQTGVIAQELAQLFPELVTMEDDGYYRVNYAALNIYTLKSVSELAQVIDSQGNVDANAVRTADTIRLDQNGVLQNITGLQMVSGGASVMGGIDNNAGGITEAGAISGATTISAEKLTLNAQGTDNMLELKKDGSGVFTVFNNGALEIRLDADNAFGVKNKDGEDIFSINTNGGLVRIGSGTADEDTILLVLDSKSTEGDPQGVNGAQYYNSASGKFRCYQNDKWQDCLPSANTEYVLSAQTHSWTQFAGETELTGNPRTWVDLTTAREVRLLTTVNNPGATGTICRLQYTQNESSNTWADLAWVGDNGVLIDTIGTKKGEWLRISPGAQAEVLVRVMCRSTTMSTSSPVLGGLRIQVR